VKKIVATVLLCCLILALTGHYFIFCIHLSKIKAEMKKELQHSWSGKTTVFIFEKKEIGKIEWEDEHEFRLKGEMYDVVDKYYKNDKLIVRCIQDKKEKELLEAYQKLTHKNTESPGQSSLLKLISTHFIATVIDALHKPQKEIKTVFFYFTSPLQKIVLSVLEQPPAFACLLF